MRGNIKEKVETCALNTVVLDMMERENLCYSLDYREGVALWGPWAGLETRGGWGRVRVKNEKVWKERV